MSRWFNDGDGYGYHIEQVPQFSQRRSIDLFDPECLRLDTAIKAVWILYRRGKWGLLQSIGLPRARYEKLFYLYDIERISSDHGLVRRVEQVNALVEYIPGIVIAAMHLNVLYRAIYMERINDVERRETPAHLD